MTGTMGFRIKGHTHFVSGRGYMATLRALTAALALHGVRFKARGKYE